jgi:cytochrome c5
MRLPSALPAHVVLGSVLLLLAACGSRPDPASDTQDTTQVADAKPAALTQIQSSSIDLPADDETFGEGPHAEVLNRTCLACHSASMVRYQPPLDRKQWTATVNKMREAYGAPFQASETTAIVDALMAQAPSRK